MNNTLKTLLTAAAILGMPSVFGGNTVFLEDGSQPHSKASFATYDAIDQELDKAHLLKTAKPKKAGDLFHDIAAHPKSNVRQILQAIEGLIEVGRNGQAKVIGKNLLGAEGVSYYESLSVLELLIPICAENEADALVKTWKKA